METQLRVLLDTIAANTRKEYMHQLRKLNLHIGQDQLLCHLENEGPLSQVELAQLLNCEASTMSNMVRSLENQEIISKVKSESDALRSFHLIQKAQNSLIPFIFIGKNSKTVCLWDSAMTIKEP